ncbi:hypothetical protein VNI00_010194 [Paramarasmius palmivorus]|uniref:Uncharacterized protein n=1 Tax=Paramarasmius palmivorus TaxID=297713 RepID=A0AAW0CKY0_9AGAR
MAARPPSKKDRPRLVPEILCEIFKTAMQDTSWKGRSNLAILDKEWHDELQPILMREVVVSKKTSLLSILENVRRNYGNAEQVRTLHIQVGCAPAIAPRTATGCGSDVTCGIRVEEQGPCGHISQQDRDNIHELLGACSTTVQKIIIHSNDTFIFLTNFIRNTAFPCVTEAEVPAETVCFSYDNNIPFPNVEKLKLSSTGGMYSTEVVSNMDFRRLLKLKQVMIGFWKTEGRLISEAILRLRVPRKLTSFAIENERGMQLPTHISILRQWVRKPWLIVLMTPLGMNAEMGNWKLHFRYGDSGGLPLDIAHAEARGMIMMNNRAEDEWESMAGHVFKRRELARTHGLYVEMI